MPNLSGRLKPSIAAPAKPKVCRLKHWLICRGKPEPHTPPRATALKNASRLRFPHKPEAHSSETGTFMESEVDPKVATSSAETLLKKGKLGKGGLRILSPPPGAKWRYSIPTGPFVRVALSRLGTTFQAMLMSLFCKRGPSLPQKGSQNRVRSGSLKVH